jgi:hypothetical protein
MAASIDSVGNKQSTKKQHFGDQEYPHTQFPGIILLLSRLEVMGDSRVTRMTAFRVGLRL